MSFLSENVCCLDSSAWKRKRFRIYPSVPGSHRFNPSLRSTTLILQELRILPVLVHVLHEFCKGQSRDSNSQEM